jgi:hypothetical protein
MTMARSIAAKQGCGTSKSRQARFLLRRELRSTLAGVKTLRRVQRTRRDACSEGRI